MKMYIYTINTKIKAEGYKSLAALPRDENFSGRRNNMRIQPGRKTLLASCSILKIRSPAGCAPLCPDRNRSVVSPVRS